MVLSYNLTWLYVSYAAYKMHSSYDGAGAAWVRGSLAADRGCQSRRKRGEIAVGRDCVDDVHL